MRIFNKMTGLLVELSDTLNDWLTQQEFHANLELKQKQNSTAAFHSKQVVKVDLGIGFNGIFNYVAYRIANYHYLVYYVIQDCVNLNPKHAKRGFPGLVSPAIPMIFIIILS